LKTERKGLAMILVSACLLGENCKYNGEHNYHAQLVKLIDKEEIIPVCPERLGGLSIPRPPAEIKAGTGREVLAEEAKVVTCEGEDVTEEFILGAKKALEIAEKNNCALAVLKARSPSCGSKEIYDGTFSGEIKEGIGVAAYLLTTAGIEVINEEEVDKLKEE
jgi:uncharacterized protein YbbK (DUF523 family)